MLEKIMNLHVLLYSMAALGGAGSNRNASHAPYLQKNAQKYRQSWPS